MQLLTEDRGGFIVARPSLSRLDATAATALRSATTDLANQGRFKVVLDLGSVEFVDSSGLGALIHMHKTLSAQGRLVLCGLGPQVTRLLKVTRVDQKIAVAATVDEAAALLAG